MPVPSYSGSHAEMMCHNQSAEAMRTHCVKEQQLSRLSFVRSVMIGVVGVMANAAIALDNPVVATYAPARCSAKALLGGDCSVECPPEQFPYCVGGLFSSCCTCVSGDYNPCERWMPKPPLSPETLSDAQDFVEWAAAYGTEGMAQLSTLAQAVIRAYRGGSDSEYAMAENTFSTQFQSLSSEEQQAARRWAARRGY